MGLFRSGSTKTQVAPVRSPDVSFVLAVDVEFQSLNKCTLDMHFSTFRINTTCVFLFFCLNTQTRKRDLRGNDEIESANSVPHSEKVPTGKNGLGRGFQ